VPPDNKRFSKLITVIGALGSVSRMSANSMTDFSGFIQQHFVNNNSLYKLDVHRSVHHNTNLIEMTNRM